MTTKRITKAIAKKVLETVDAGLTKGIGKPILGEMCVEAAVCYALGEPHGDEPSCVDPTLRAFKIGLNDASWSSEAARAKGLRRLALAQLGSKGHLDAVEFSQRLVLAVVNKLLPPMLRREGLGEAAAQCERAADFDAAHYAADAAYDAAYDAASDAAHYAVHAAHYAADAAHYAADAAYDAAHYAASDAAHDAASDAAHDAAHYAVHAAHYAVHAAHYAADAAYDAAHYAADAAHYAAHDAAHDAALSQFAEDAVQILIAMKAPGTKWLYLTE